MYNAVPASRPGAAGDTRGHGSVLIINHIIFEEIGHYVILYITIHE